MRAIPWKLVSYGPLLWYSFKDLSRSIARMIIRRIWRDKERVLADYEAGQWKGVLDKKVWKHAQTLESFLIGSSKRILLAKIEGKAVKVACDDYYRYRLNQLHHIMSTHAGDTNEIIELGCGFGLNIFSLYLLKHWGHLHGFDISSNGILAAREIASHYKVGEHVDFDQIDLLESSHPNFKSIEDKVVFTFHCIEQIPHGVEKVVENILRHRPKRVIHIEPTTEILSFSRLLDWCNYAYILSVDYQRRLHSVLAKMEKDGAIQIIAKQRLNFAPTIHNEHFMIVWEPT